MQLKKYLKVFFVKAYRKLEYMIDHHVSMSEKHKTILYKVNSIRSKRGQEWYGQAQ